MGSLPPSTPHIPGNVLVTQGEISAHSSGQAPRIPQKKKQKKKKQTILQWAPEPCKPALCWKSQASFLAEVI